MPQPSPLLPGKRRLAMAQRTWRSIRRGPRPQTFPALSREHLPAMFGRVEIVRDARGIPHIYSEHEVDLYAALGFLQAADRFPSIDVLRHLGAGRVSELLGNLRMPKTSDMFPGKRVSDLDAFIRPLDFEAQSERDYQQLEGRPRACLDAFSSGINAALQAMRGVYPPEYLLLGAVRPWRPSDTLIAARTCAFCVALAPLDVELSFDAIRLQLGDEMARRFYPEAPWQNAPPPHALQSEVDTEPPLHLTGVGSNNWAVSGARSASGAPIFANDPHVPFLPMPTFWYHAHLECPKYRVQGGLMLGCPIFGYGHNGFLAWGITTAYRDAWDLYRIRRSPQRSDTYRTVSGDSHITKHRESHAVRFGRAVPLEWESCEHGIIYPGWKHRDGSDLSLRYVKSDAGRFFHGYLKLAEAQTVDAHRAALTEINEGPFDFNHMYAHKDGDIAWEPYGRLPRRAADGLFVRDADDPLAQWDGYRSFAENPKIINPPHGYVATANSFTCEDQSERLSSRVHPEPRYRQTRIEAFLAARNDHDVQSFAALQGDIATDYALPVRDALAALLAEPCAKRGDVVREALSTFQAWDGVFDTDSAGAALFALSLRELVPRCFVPLLGPDVGRHYINTRRGVPRLHRLLLDAGDPLRHDIEHAADKHLGTLVMESFEAAVLRLVEVCGAAPRQWRWGGVHRIVLGTLLGELPLIGRHFQAADTEFSGDLYSVSPSIPIPSGKHLRSLVGATSRFICDLGRPEEALFAHTSGPSGDIGTTYYASLTEPWLRFRYFKSKLWKADEIPDPVERLVIG